MQTVSGIRIITELEICKLMEIVDLISEWQLFYSKCENPSDNCICSLVPKHARQCNAVAWNPVDPNLLVVGLDKYRYDHSILLWDITKSPTSSERLHHHELRPIAEAGVTETTHSLAWFKRESKCLVVGANNKTLKIIDFRGDAIFDDLQ